MRISQIVIDPGHGYRDGVFDHGHQHGNLTEAEIIDAYRHSIEEEIYMEGVRCIVIDSRNAKGQIVDYPDNSLVLRLHAGWNPLSTVVNMSQVLFASTEAKEIAEKLSKICFDWGKRINWMHGNGGVKATKEFPSSGIVVELQPVLVNGPGTADLYFKHLIHLGTQIGNVAALYAKASNVSLGFKPRQVPERAAVSRKTSQKGTSELKPHLSRLSLS